MLTHLFSECRWCLALLAWGLTFLVVCVSGPQLKAEEAPLPEAAAEPVDSAEEDEDRVVAREGEPDVLVWQHSEAMEKAIERAKAELPEFIAALEEPCEGCSDFSIKVAFDVADGSTEYMWLRELAYDEEAEQFTGELANSPVYTDAVMAGDEIKTSRERIVDWIYIKDDELVGGYTVAVIDEELAQSKLGEENEKKDPTEKSPDPSMEIESGETPGDSDEELSAAQVLVDDPEAQIPGEEVKAAGEENGGRSRWSVDWF